jgi:hypothetical protein
MLKSILCYPCCFLTSFHSTTPTKDNKIPINNMYSHDTMLNKIQKEQIVLFNKRSFGLNTSKFIYNYFYDKMKKTDIQYIPLKSRDELLDSLVNSKISLNEID